MKQRTETYERYFAGLIMRYGGTTKISSRLSADLVVMERWKGWVKNCLQKELGGLSLQEKMVTVWPENGVALGHIGCRRFGTADMRLLKR